MSKKRKRYSPEEKVSILRRHLLDGVPVSDLCDAHGIHPTMFYQWPLCVFRARRLSLCPKAKCSRETASQKDCCPTGQIDNKERSVV